jgi:rod shape-determining protein MreD
MVIDTFRRLLVFIAFWLAQALVFNHIHLFGFATILLYVYFVVMFPRNYPRWAILLWSFSLGLCVDMFSNTPGMAAASLTLVGFIQPYLLELFLPREAAENMKTSLATLGLIKFLTLSAILVFIHCLLFFTLESFTFFNWQQWLLNIGGSTVLTLVMLMTLETIRK